MTRDEARTVLGVGRDATSSEVRSAFRRLARTHHPDLAGAASTATAARVNEAYAVLREPPAVDPPTSAPPSSAPRPPPPSSDRTIPLPSPTVAVFEQLCAAADILGDLSYVDVECAILDTVVTWDGWPPCSLLVTVQQRGPDTLAQCTLESLTGAPGPPIDQVVAELHRILDALGE